MDFLKGNAKYLDISGLNEAAQWKELTDIPLGCRYDSLIEKEVKTVGNSFQEAIFYCIVGWSLSSNAVLPSWLGIVILAVLALTVGFSAIKTSIVLVMTPIVLVWSISNPDLRFGPMNYVAMLAKVMATSLGIIIIALTYKNWIFN